MDLSTSERATIARRSVLKAATAVAAGLVAGPAAALRPAGATTRTAAAATATDTVVAFVDDYRTNVVANLTPETNAAVRILTGMQQLWKTGATWDSGVVLAPDVLRANVRHCVAVTTTRTEEQARRAFLADRQHQSYSTITGLGPLAELYRTGAQAVTGITTAPETTPPTPVSDTLPADAPPGSALGAGSTSSALGLVAELVNTVRGPFASGNPSKFAYQYPRPWRLTEDSEAIDTGTTDALGYPVYESDVVVVTQLLRQRSTNPAEDGGYPSGHTNAFHLACLAYAYAVPERFQELVACAFDLSDTRIDAGMHSPVDVVSGRILATALAAAALADPQNAALKTAARAQAAEYFQAQTGTTADTLYAYAHSADVDTDPYADRAANARAVAERLTYRLPGRVRPAPMTVPKGAEVLLETRLPYLDAAQRREVLRTTALPAGHPLLDGTELWGRLNLFAAADGYGAFDDDVLVSLDAEAGGFGATDSWRNDITGRGGLTKLGTGALTLSGVNRYRGGTTVRAGTLTAAGPDALGAGDVEVAGGTLRLAAACPVTVRGAYRQSAGVLAVPAGHDRGPALAIEGTARLGRGSVLQLRLDAARPGQVVPVLRARRLTGRFSSVAVDLAGYRAVPVYTARGVSVRLIAD